MMTMDLLRKGPNGPLFGNNAATLVAASVPFLLMYGLTQINWPRTIFRCIVSVVAPTKERIWPSDDESLSPQVRGLAWVLLSGPPPPHDIQPIRTMMKYFWPNVWPPQGDDIRVEQVPTPRIDSESLWISPPTQALKDASACLIHLHGGGMVAGTTGTEQGLAVELSRRLGVPVLSVDYRLVPDNTVADGVEDVVAAYQWLLKNHPHIKQISFLGGSAGAMHSLLAAIIIKELCLQIQPTSLVLSSPAPGMEFLPGGSNNEDERWTSLQENAPKDGFMAGEFYQYVTSVVYNDETNQAYFRRQLSKLSGLPPCLVTAGTYEVILDGVRSLVKALRDANSNGSSVVTYKEYWKMQHCHFTFFEFTPESSVALDELVAWLQDTWKAKKSH
jgi:acetyl esterase/lipase